MGGSRAGMAGSQLGQGGDGGTRAGMAGSQRKRKNSDDDGSASAETPSRGGKGGRRGCTSPSVTTNLLLQIKVKTTFLRNSGARRGRTTSHYFGTHVRLGRSNRHWRARRHWRGRRLLHMSTSAGLPGLPGKPGVSGTTSDAPEEATQRPPCLALRGPSHSHPGALLHSRRRITPHRDPRQNPEVSHRGGARRGAGALPVSKVGDVTLPIG